MSGFTKFSVAVSLVLFFFLATALPNQAGASHWGDWFDNSEDDSESSDEGDSDLLCQVDRFLTEIELNKCTDDRDALSETIDELEHKLEHVCEWAAELPDSHAKEKIEEYAGCDESADEEDENEELLDRIEEFLEGIDK